MSQCSRILALLADGRPHPMLEIHDRVGTCRLNSRIAELRKRGHTITCDPAKGRYVYTLVGGLDEGSARAGVGPSSSTLTGLSPESSAGGDGLHASAVATAEQLSLEVAA